MCNKWKKVCIFVPAKRNYVIKILLLKSIL